MNHKAGIVDASVFIAFFRSTEEHHDAAKKIVDSLERMYIPDLVFSEVVTVITYKDGVSFGKKVSRQLIENEAVSVLHCDSSGFQKILGLLSSAGKKLSIPDYSLLYHASVLDVPLFTFDEQLKKISRKFPV